MHLSPTFFYGGQIGASTLCMACSTFWINTWKSSSSSTGGGYNQTPITWPAAPKMGDNRQFVIRSVGLEGQPPASCVARRGLGGRVPKTID